MKKIINNKGFSLLELIIVMAIGAVMVGLVTVTLAMVNNGNVSKAANAYASAINTAKVKCMSKGPAAGELFITAENGAIYVQIGPDGDREQICTNAISVYYVKGSYTDVTGIGVNPTGNVNLGSISFNSAGMVSNPTSDTIRKLIFQKGDRKVETVLYLETGKHEVNLL